MNKLSQDSIAMHTAHHGKLSILSKVPLLTKHDLSMAYSPGVAAVCTCIECHPEDAYTMTGKGNAVAIVSDGSAVLGLGNIGPCGALPVMEGKALLMKQFADIDAYPIVLDTQDSAEIISIVKAIAPGFGAINLEDISAPRCFEILRGLQDIGIPVFHDDQDGTAIVVRAALKNALKVVDKKFKDITIVISGAGAAGSSIAHLLPTESNIIVCDSKGIISNDRKDLNSEKLGLLSFTNPKSVSGTLADALVGADVFIGVSAPGILSLELVSTMSENPIVFALANPDPEFDPALLPKSKIAVYATGRSDLPNQVNNVLAFPGIFRALLDQRYVRVESWMMIAASDALANLVQLPTNINIIPDAFDDRVVDAIVAALKKPE